MVGFALQQAGLFSLKAHCAVVWQRMAGTFLVNQVVGSYHHLVAMSHIILAMSGPQLA